MTLERKETAYLFPRYSHPQVPHRYGMNVHVLEHPGAFLALANLCSPAINATELVLYMRLLYRELAWVVAGEELPRHALDRPTRMLHTEDGEGRSCGVGLDRQARVVTVSVARAGLVPSQAVYDLLNLLLLPRQVRQEHLFMSRVLNEAGEVVGSELHESKCSPDMDNCTVLIPDPMGATGGSMCRAVAHIKSLEGVPANIIALHLMVTPEYLKRVKKEHPDLRVYTFRVDRGLSCAEVLNSTLGTYENERGLTDNQYIFPGAGGIGELMNNSFV